MKNKTRHYDSLFLGVGYCSERVDGKTSKISAIWKAMLHRTITNQKHYEDVSVCKEWYDFKVFCDWYRANYFETPMCSLTIDKDILSGEKRIYSAETCGLVPNTINSSVIYPRIKTNGLQTGLFHDNDRFRVVFDGEELGSFDTIGESSEVHRLARIDKVHRLAEKYKYGLSDRMYNGLLNWVG
jgi:hypothetical protein